ncbi:MAG: sigma 54-interacting transcriptional regulator [Planctomycetes bacterium]|nr:sigma 54-interacting transcriptional regulator [Planctomycetota bacterium]
MHADNSPEVTRPESPDRLRRERDFLARLLALGAHEDIDPILREGLALVAELTGARQGYIEVRSEASTADPHAPPAWWAATGLRDDAVERVRAALSRGVVAEAIATGNTVRSPSAREDPRFTGRESVKANEIDAVLCAPLGTTSPVGVLYLQSRRTPGPFTDDDARLVETFALFLAPRIGQILARSAETSRADPTAAARAKLRLPAIVGSSLALARVLDAVVLVAPLDLDVLLTGPTGTGKTALARAIALNSPRAAGPFVEINCAALPENLVESELFGARVGAHSTASRDTPGKVAAADGGTLFLDEVGELPIAVQAKLLQLVTEKQYYPLGSPRPVRADVRILAATNVELESAVAAGRFRADLFWRLNVVPIRVPALAARREDVPALVRHLTDEACRRLAFPPLVVAPSALHAAESADWPGNVRQLANTVQQAVMRCRAAGDDTIRRAHLFPEDAAGAPATDRSFDAATRKFQKQHLLEVLEATSWNVAEAARVLDLTRSHVYNLLNLHGLRREP